MDTSDLLKMTNLTEWIKCPICLEIPSASIFQCQTGHTVCESCRMRITSCPICQAPMTDTKNFLAQELAQKLQVNCKYEPFGCTHQMSGAERESHHNICELRPVICQLPHSIGNDCGKSVRMDNYVQHVLKEHSAKSLHNNTPKNFYSQGISCKFDGAKKSRIQSTTDLPSILHWKLGGVDFLLFTGTYSFVTPYWALYYVESEFQKPDSEYWATITVAHPITKVELSFTAPANSIRNSPEETTRAGKCLSVNWNIFNALSYYEDKRQYAEWMLRVSFENVGELTAPLALTEITGNSCSPRAGSSSSSINADILKQRESTAVWPFSPDSDKMITIAVETNYKTKHGGGVCIVRGGKGRPAVYSTCLNFLKDSTAVDEVEFDAHNAKEVISCFKKIFTPGCSIYLACLSDISRVRVGGNNYLFNLNQQVNSFRASRENLRFVFVDYNTKRLECIAVNALLDSTTLCHSALQSAGIVRINDQDLQ